MLVNLVCNRYRWQFCLLFDSYLLSLFCFINKIEKILKGSLDSIPSPLPSVKIQIVVATPNMNPLASGLLVDMWNSPWHLLTLGTMADYLEKFRKSLFFKFVTILNLQILNFVQKMILIIYIYVHLCFINVLYFLI